MKITEYKTNRKTEIVSRLLSISQELPTDALKKEAKDLLLELLVVVTKEAAARRKARR